MHELLNELHGAGILSLSDGVLVPVSFRFPPGPGSDNRIHVAIERDVHAMEVIRREASRDPLRPCRLAGTTEQRAEITCDRVLIDKWSKSWPSISGAAQLFPYSDIIVSYPRESGSQDSATEQVFLLCNLLFRGDEMVERAETMDPGATTIHIAGSDVRMRMLQEYEETKAKLGQHPKGLVTAEARLTSERPIQDVFSDTILPFCVLATLAEHCFVVPVCSATRDELGWRTVRYQPVKTYPFASVDPAIDIARANRRALKEYIEGCHGPYMQQKEALKLDVLIEYAVNGSLGQTRETRYLMFCVGLECLADCAERVLREAGVELPLPGYEKNLDLLRAFLLKRSMPVTEDEIRALCRSVSYNRPGWKAVLKAFFEHVGVTHTSSDLDFIEVRNTLVHTGLFPSSGAGSRDYARELEDFYDKVVLTIVKYGGRERVVRAKGFAREAL